MSDTERIIGAMEEFKKTTYDRLKDIEIAIRDLQSFKWKTIGMAMLISGSVAVVVEYIHYAK